MLSHAFAWFLIGVAVTLQVKLDLLKCCAGPGNILRIRSSKLRSLGSRVPAIGESGTSDTLMVFLAGTGQPSSQSTVPSASRLDAHPMTPHEWRMLSRNLCGILRDRGGINCQWVDVDLALTQLHWTRELLSQIAANNVRIEIRKASDASHTREQIRAVPREELPQEHLDRPRPPRHRDGQQRRHHNG